MNDTTIPCAPRSITDKILPWMSAITMPLLIGVVTILWGINNQVSAYAAENEVLKHRVTQNERAMLDMKSSAVEITKAVTQMQVIQSTHNALMQSEVAHIKNDMNKISEFVRQQERTPSQ